MDLLTLLSPRNLIIFVIIFTRLSGFAKSAPLLSTFPIPMQVKTWFMATVAFLLFPILMHQVTFPTPTTIPELSFVLIKEFIIGYSIGFIANIVFVATEIAAELVSMQMGLTAAQAMNPATGDTSPVLGQAYTLIISMVFLSINAFGFLFAAIYKTFEIFPPSYQVVLAPQFTHNFIQVTSQIFTIGFTIALPLFSVLLISDILLGFTAKMMPRMNIFTVALPVKIWIGLGLLSMLLPQLYTTIKSIFEKYLTGIITILGG
ncbi:MAG: flagellar biosynthetic protein FliR [bacterium]|nr:flagellar biosynthetic protein FliR [bacterium]